jgi:hypothetical protein
LILKVIHRSRGDSKLPTALKKERKLKEKTAARRAGRMKKEVREDT